MPPWENINVELFSIDIKPWLKSNFQVCNFYELMPFTLNIFQLIRHFDKNQTLYLASKTDYQTEVHLRNLIAIQVKHFPIYIKTIKTWLKSNFRAQNDVIFVT